MAKPTPEEMLASITWVSAPISTNNYDEVTDNLYNRSRPNKKLRKQLVAVDGNTSPAMCIKHRYADGTVALVLLDGHNRKRICIEEGLPFTYIIGEMPYDPNNADLIAYINKDTQGLNFVDYVDIHSKGGNDNYIRLKRYLGFYKGMPNSAVAEIAAPRPSERGNVPNGTYSIDKKSGHKRLNTIYALAEVAGDGKPGVLRLNSCRALLTIIKHPNYKDSRMHSVLSRESTRELNRVKADEAEYRDYYVERYNSGLKGATPKLDL